MRRYRTLALILLLAGVSILATACPRVISLNYSPSNQLTGQGEVQVLPFEYVPYTKGLVRSREAQKNPKGVGTLILSDNIGVLFTNALKSELEHSGYQVVSEHEVKITGTVDRFYLDWVGETDKTFELEATFEVRSRESVIYSETAKSTQRGPKDLLIDVRLINGGLKDCIEQFIRGAQAEQVL